MSFNLDSVKNFIYALLAVFGLGWILKAQKDKERLRALDKNKEVQDALREASKAIKNIPDSELDARIRKHLSSDDDTTH